MAQSECSIRVKQKECAVFNDDSNIFIEAQKRYGIQYKLCGGQDPRIRIDIGKLLNVLVCDRTLISASLYGSIPPPRDTVWIAYHKQESLKVETFRKNQKGKEKQIDTTLAINASFCVCENRDKTKTQTLVLVAGDIDYERLVVNAIKCDWCVEIFAFASAISKRYQELEGPKCKINKIDDIVHAVCFVERSYNKPVRNMPVDRTKVLDFEFQKHNDVTNAQLRSLANDNSNHALSVSLFPRQKFYSATTNDIHYRHSARR